MKTFKRITAVVFLTVVVVAPPVLIPRRAQEVIRAKNEIFRLKALESERLAAENGLLSNVVAKTQSSRRFSPAENTELLRLRGEFGELTSLLRQTNQLDREIHQIHKGLQELAAETQSSEDSALALADQQLRSARVEKLKQWLANRPKEMIPELQLLSEDRWIRSAEWARVTDEEYSGWISSLRGSAESQFASQAYKALKQYASDNDGGFPADLSQLKPYFATPIDDAILQRYQIVPANSLIPNLVENLGDWVITQKAPVNEQYDMRVAISATSFRGTFQAGRWGPGP